MKLKQAGYTLIELMITVAIVGILATIAIPSYQESVRKSRRTDAEGVLLAVANAMERHFTNDNTYCDAGGGGGTGAALSDCGEATNDTGTPTVYSIPDETKKYYTITIDTIPPANIDTTSKKSSAFRLKAVPTGAQTGDKCGNLTLTQAGAKDINGNDVGVTADDCW